SQTKVLHSRALVADMHAHPSLKIYMFNKKFHKRYWSGGAFNPFAMRVDLPKCIEGGLNLLFSSVYLPEKGLLKDCWILNLASYVAPCKWRDMLKKNPFEQTNKILDAFERAVARSKINGKEVAEIAYSLADVHRILNAGKIVILHTLEGAHPLDGKIENLKKFYDRGVCSLTLAHFYENRVVFPTDGIPANMKILCCF
ncbi:MAG: hypothetical protein GWN59_00015, partial [Calditrichae bacterium]|nr:hypothetical protein [Calditrichia bacterium]